MFLLVIIAMATDEITPRTLIQGLIETSSVSKSTARVRARRSNTGNRVAALKRDDKTRARSVSDLTPRSLIQGVLQNTEVEQSPPSKRPRHDTPETDRPQARTPGTLPHSTTRRKVTRLEALATPGGDPTPRSLIQGLIGTAPVETPAIHLRRSSSLNPADFPDVEEALQGRANRDTLSPLVREPTANQSQPPASTLRKRQPISSEDFAAGVREKLSKKQDQEAEEGAEDDGGEVDDEAADEPSQGASGEFQESISEDAREESFEAATHPQEEQQDNEEEVDDVEDEGDKEMVDAPEDVGVSREGSLEDEEADPDSAMTSVSGPGSTPTSSQATPPAADRSTRKPANKQAADSTWTGRESEASIPSQRDSSPGGTRRVPDSTVVDSGSEGSEAIMPNQSMEESLLGEDPEAQQTAAQAESRLSGFSPLVTPRLPPSSGRPTPALKKTPAHHRQQAAQGAGPSKAVPKQAPQKKKSPTAPRKETACLPASLTKSILSHFSKARMSKGAVDAVEKGAEAFFKRLSNDLTAYSRHAHRQTIEQSDVELLMRRQGLIQDQQSMYALIEKYLPLEYRQELIPMATAGNKVTPKPTH
ncbi:centromere protein T-like isoform X2 [Patiria miniata]|uniref:CENP-T/Histone H4 histone fold domain-containing protein n=1 Tax=Patiria miniata TaxID=46514 RepID=A0A914AZ45_PATMI|nr:centromere protein T-like isoform X2 [Patiria miniata]